MEWGRAIAAAYRSLATEPVALADQALHIAVKHVSVRVQSGSPTGAPVHAPAPAAAGGQIGKRKYFSMTRGGTAGRRRPSLQRLQARRAHRDVADAVLQVCRGGRFDRRT